MNAARQDAGCPALRIDERLRDAAQMHSQDMADHNYFSHTSADGTTPAQRAEASGYDAFSGENIASGQPSSEDVVAAWMNSSGHRRNILNCQSAATGVGYVESNDGPLWTVSFGFE